MSQHDGLAIESIKAHLNETAVPQLTGAGPNPFDQYRLAPNPSSPLHPSQDPIQQATDAITSLAHPKPVDPNAPLSPRDIAAARDAANLAASRAQAEAAKQKLAQEALLANPAEMRKLFPKVYNDVSINHNNHLDKFEIDKGLQNQSLSQDERNLLTVFKAGYEHFSIGPFLTWGLSTTTTEPDFDGVSARSLTAIDKAVNRGIKDDPFYSVQTKVTPAAMFAVGALTSLALTRGASPRVRLTYAVGSGLFGAAYGEGAVIMRKYDGYDDTRYDAVKNDYQSFVKTYGKEQSRPK